ncbi:glycoside hydrolase family 172 protein [Haloprofundus halobius]|uniref:glycoside hydrolase family 172 protein n=1 Tax=Haloprofundus halobius TaxID=2876194 RepID=UPI001CCD7A07|nr:glycoside hydrolase family 172 protein [Haloprofundus halobius]
MRFRTGLDDITQLSDEKSRSITAENPDGAVGAGGKEASNLGPARKGRPCLRNVEPGSTETLAEIDGPGVIKHIWMTVRDETDSGPTVLRDLVLRMYWDDENDPSVEVPLGDFFCNGHAMRCEVNSEPIIVVPEGGFNCYFPMPFRDDAKITIESEHPEEIPALFYQIDYSLVPELDDDTAYFHAQWRREKPTTIKEDYTIVDDISGKGHFVGTYLAWTALEEYWWGEGEVKCYIDGDEEYPTICGTGTEDYVGGAWCFNDPSGSEETFPSPMTYSTPYLGYPLYDDGSDGQGRPPRHGLYRWHIPDPIHFDEDLRVTVQQIGHNSRELFERSDAISSVAYWYQSEPHNSFPELPERNERIPL